MTRLVSEAITTIVVRDARTVVFAGILDNSITRIFSQHLALIYQVEGPLVLVIPLAKVELL